MVYPNEEKHCSSQFRDEPTGELLETDVSIIYGGILQSCPSLTGHKTAAIAARYWF